MSRVSQSKFTYTLDQSVEHFLQLKVVKRVIQDKVITSQNVEELKKFFEVHHYSKCYDQIFMNLSYFVKHDLTDYYDRFMKLRQVNKNSKEWFEIQMGGAGTQLFYNRYYDNPTFQNREPGGRSSKSALLFFRQLDQILKENNICVRSLYQDSENNKHEFRIRDENKKWFCYDYTIKELNLIIEYHGEHIHPRLDQIGSEWKHLYTAESADIVYLRDMYKQKVAEEKGYAYHIIWHGDTTDIRNMKIGKIFNELDLSSLTNIDIIEISAPKTIYGQQYILTLPDGKEIQVKGHKSIIKNYGLTQWNVECLSMGRIKEYKGYKLRRVEP